MFNRLISSKQYQDLKNSFREVLGKKVFWLEMDYIPKNIEDFMQHCSFINERNKKRFKKSSIKILDALKKTRQIKKTQVLQLASNSLTYVFPLKKEKKVFGYIILFNVNRNFFKKYNKIFKNYLETTILKVQDDLELARLYETIQPRAVALSTIHTIHRIISSTLNLKQLLPKIARLSLQVMRVKRCSVYLMSKTKKILNHEITVTDKGEIFKKTEIESDKDLANRVAKSALPILTETSLAMPLIEEDVLGVIVVSDKKDDKPFSYFDQEILTTLSEQAVVAIKNATLYKQQEKLASGSIKSLMALSGSRKIESHIPTIEFRKLVTAIAKELGLSKDKMNALNYAALLHDIGKISIPEKILNKDKSLTSKEYKIIKEHPMRTTSIIKHIKVLEPAIPIILHHHEKYNGQGYPDGLKKEEIPIGARILAVVDAFEAMITKRPYRRVKTIKQAIKEIEKNSGIQFDPKVVKAFLKVIRKRKIRKP